MNISERMQRNESTDQIEVGNIIDVALKGNFGLEILNKAKTYLVKHKEG